MKEFINTNSELIVIFIGLFTVVLTIIMTILTFQIKRLTKHDNQKLLAINELKQQTVRLTNLYLNQIAPRFAVSSSFGDSIDIKNVGGDAFNLVLETDGEYPLEHERFLDFFKDFFSSHSKKKIVVRPFEKDSFTFTFTFEDVEGNKYKQMLFVNKRKFSPLKKITKYD